MKTQPTDRDVVTYLDTVTPIGRRQDAVRLLDIFQDVTTFDPVMWGPSIIGFGRYDYTYKTGHSGSFLATGFAPRKANMVLYIMPGYSDFGPILDRIGPHRLGKSCLYFTRLDRLDEAALRALIQAGLDNLALHWPVLPK